MATAGVGSVTRAVRLIGVGWLIVAAYYAPWTYVIGRKIVAGAVFTVDAWTMATPFVILCIAPIGALATWRKEDFVGRALLALVALNWLLWAVISAGILHDFIWMPTLLKTILFLSVLTLGHST
jgi:O-antigen ligase